VGLIGAKNIEGIQVLTLPDFLRWRGFAETIHLGKSLPVLMGTGGDYNFFDGRSIWIVILQGIQCISM